MGCTSTTLTVRLMSPDLVSLVTLKPWLVTKKMKSLSSSTICQSLPKWQLWPKLAAICSNFCKDTPQRHLAASLSAYLGNKLQLTAKTSKSKKATRHGLSESSRRDSAPLASLTNLELSRFLPRKRKVNFGKPEEWILRKTNPETEVKNIFTFRFPGKKQKKKTNANLFSLKLQENSYWFCLSSSCLYNKQLLPQNDSIHNFDSFFSLHTTIFSVIFSKCFSICQTLL